MSSLLVTIGAFAVALGVLITVHEFGHFWVARRLGVKVLRFSVGFGKPIWMRRGRVDGTEYVIGALPLGGYVKMLGEQDEEGVTEEERHRSFNRKPLAARTAIVVAGPLFNFLFAILAYWAVFTAGESGIQPIIGTVAPGSAAEQAGIGSGDRFLRVGGRETPTWEAAMFALMVESLEGEPVAVRIEDGEGRVMDREIVVERGASSSREILSGLGIRPWRPPVPPVLGKLVEGGAAEQAGLASGDRIVVADGTPVEDWSEWVVFVQDRPEQPIGVVIERDGVRMHLELTPKRVEVGGQAIGRIGAYVQMPDDSFDGYRAELRYPLGEALIQAVAKTWDVSVLTLRMLGYMLVGHASVDNLSGPISIAQYAGKSVSVGFTYFLKFLAVVSISLGVLNLLPIPLLDGGHLFYFVVEALKGSPLSEQAQMLGQRIGLAILLGLMGLAFYLDIGRLLG